MLAVLYLSRMKAFVQLVGCMFGLGLSLCVSSTLQAQTIVRLYPTEDAVTTSQMPTTNWGGHTQLSAYAWTQGGQFSLHRSYFKFDFQHLSLGRPLLRATLHLKYFDPVGYPHTGSNQMRISICDTNWSEHQINWLNQPEELPGLYVDVPAATGFQDLAIDVLPLVLYQFYNLNTGLVIRLIEESTYRMVLFGSRENEGYVPELELEFLDLNTRCDTFSDPGTLDLVQLNSAFPQSSIIQPSEFSIGSNPAQNFQIRRAYLKPNLTLLPPGANLIHANLRMIVHNDQQLPNAGNTSLSMYPLNQAVSINSLNWGNQPSYSTQAAAHALAPKTDFGAVNFDVKSLLERSMTTGQYNGYLLKQNDETSAGISYFAGNSFAIAPSRPTLLVCYTVNTSVHNTASDMELRLFPNPAKDQVKVSFVSSAHQSLSLHIRDMQGRLVYEQTLTDPLNGNVELQLSTAGFANGVYTLGVMNGQHQAFEKLVIAH